MADHGMMMSDPMMRAVLSGEKTVTRRTSNRWARARVGDRLWFREVWRPDVDVTGIDAPHTIRGYSYRCDGRFEQIAGSDDWTLDALLDDWWRLWANGKSSAWRSSMVMPRAVCRATGIITSLRHEPLQDIDEADALREGMGTVTWDDIVALKGFKKALQSLYVMTRGGVSTAEDAIDYHRTCSMRDRFRLVFDLLNPGQWPLNPLVWRVEWERE